MSPIERDELIERLIEADEALFGSGDGVSHRETAEAALRVVEEYVDQKLGDATDLLREIAESDPVDNALDPDRNRRIAQSFFPRSGVQVVSSDGD